MIHAESLSDALHPPSPDLSAEKEPLNNLPLCPNCEEIMHAMHQCRDPSVTSSADVSCELISTLPNSLDVSHPHEISPILTPPSPHISPPPPQPPVIHTPAHAYFHAMMMGMNK